MIAESVQMKYSRSEEIEENALLHLRRSGIYQITNRQGFCKYVGKSVDIADRWRHHIQELRQNRHCNAHLQNAWNKYGRRHFLFSVIEFCRPGELTEREQYWINKLSPEYNVVTDVVRWVSTAHKKRNPKKRKTPHSEHPKNNPALPCNNPLHLPSKVPSATTPSELAKRLQGENRSGRSWRRIAREDYKDKVNFATLNRIANSGGKWLPKKRKILIALGLVARKPMPEWMKRWRRLPKEKREELIRRFVE